MIVKTLKTLKGVRTAVDAAKDRGKSRLMDRAMPAKQEFEPIRAAYPERLTFNAPRGARALAEEIAGARGVSTGEVLREALASIASQTLPHIVTSEPATMILADDDAKSYVESALDVTIAEPFSGVIIQRGGETIGAIIFNLFTGSDVHITMATTKPIGVSAVRQIARYVFGQLRCRRVTAVTRANNRRAIRALTRLGFCQEGVMRQRFANGDGLIFGLLRSEQKIMRFQ